MGHSGISGAFAFYSPTSGMYLAGTVNQLKKRQAPYKLMLRAIGATEACAKHYSPLMTTFEASQKAKNKNTDSSSGSVK